MELSARPSMSCAACRWASRLTSWSHGNSSRAIAALVTRSGNATRGDEGRGSIPDAKFLPGAVSKIRRGSAIVVRLAGGGKEIRTLGLPSEGLRFFRNSPVQFGNSPSDSKTSSFETGTAGPFPPWRLRTCNRPGIVPGSASRYRHLLIR